MRKLIIDAVQECIDKKKEVLLITSADPGLSINMIRKIVESFLYGIDKADPKLDETVWNVKQHFMRKYGI